MHRTRDERDEAGLNRLLRENVSRKFKSLLEAQQGNLFEGKTESLSLFSLQRELKLCLCLLFKI